MKKAIIIGATSGIGKELALILAENNYKTGITGRRKNKLKELKESNPDKFIIKSFDSATDDNSKKLTELTEELNGLDLLILSAGTGDINQNLDYKIEYETNLLNVVAFTEITIWAYKYFEKQGHGHLVTISSIAGLRGGRTAPSYNASKAFQINYIQGLKQKAAKLDKKIYITDIRPGFVDTDMSKGDNLFWVSSPKKAAKQIFKAIRKKKTVAYITKRWQLIAFIIKILPDFIYNRL